MLINLIRYSLRSFKRQRSYIVINVLGLSIGIACSLLISFYVINELSFDRFNKKYIRIFRVIQNVNFVGQGFVASYTPAVLGPTVFKEFPEIEDFLRMFRRQPINIEYEGRTFTEDHLVEADSSFFNFFSIPVIKGDAGSLLNAPRKIVLTASTAKKIFGNENPVDKVLKIGSDTIGYTVSGVMADVPENSHFEANTLLSFMTNPASVSQVWMNNSFSTYLLLKPGTSYQKADKKIKELIFNKAGTEIQQLSGISMNDWIAKGNKYEYYLQNLADIHLDTSVQQEFKEAGDPIYMRIIGSLGILILLIASINFMNLSTAQASKRVKEVGIKKVSGSTRGLLIMQFLTESIILSFVSLLLALVLFSVSLPYFNNLIGANLSLNIFAEWYSIPFLLLFTLVAGFLSGTYPAFFLSSFNADEVLKGSMRRSLQTGTLRKILVVFQFCISIMLIVGSIIMYRQTNFMISKDPGFNKEQVIVINKSQELGVSLKPFKETIKNIAGVNNVSSSTSVPGRNRNSMIYNIEGDPGKEKIIETNYVDYDYLDTYGITIVSGNSLNESSDSERQSCLINETAVRDFGITDIALTRFTRPGGPKSDGFLQPVGVVKDFQFKSLKNRITPYLLRINTDNIAGDYLSVKMAAGNYRETIAVIQNKWKEFTGNKPFDYYFIDDDFERMYITEKQNALIAVTFSVLAILIAALGLFGLTSFEVEQRTKEIGVRKAMGSSVTEVFFVISRHVIILIVISALISCPLIYYIAGAWLENFYYRINPGVFSFISGIILALGIAIMTISYRILRAAWVNPAQSLKYE
jgi:putative ABC transport system permease protein